MGNMIKLAEREIMRGEILRLCREAAPVGCSRQVLGAALQRAGLDTEEMDKERFYLKEKGLIRTEHTENRRLGISRDICSITAEGMDYLDGNGLDLPGIEV